MNKSLVEYIESTIIPMYDGFDAGHGREHVNAVVEEALRLAEFYEIIQGNGGFDVIIGNPPYVEYNKKVKGVAVSDIYKINGYTTFTEQEIEIIAQAAEDHRASSDHEPRTVYGKIVAEADRQIIPESIIVRTVQYGFKHYPELDKEGHWARLCEHMAEKYDVGGYLKLWIPESRNAEGLTLLRDIIHKKSRLREYFEAAYDDAVKSQGR